MLDALREEVLEANLELVRRGLVLYTFGNASGIDRARGLVAIKPSGVPYEKMKSSDITLVDLDGKTVEGTLRPSSDLATHLILYQAFPAIGGVVHTHSRNATVWAQAARPIPCFGTTHADYFYGPIPVTEHLRASEIEEAGSGIQHGRGKRADALSRFRQRHTRNQLQRTFVVEILEAGDVARLAQHTHVAARDWHPRIFFVVEPQSFAKYLNAPELVFSSDVSK